MKKDFKKKYLLYSTRSLFDCFLAGVTGSSTPTGYGIKELYERDGKYYKCDYTSQISYQEEERKITRYHQYFKNKNNNNLAKKISAKIKDLNKYVDEITSITDIGEVVAVFDSLDDVTLFLELENLTDSCEYDTYKKIYKSIKGYLIKYPTRRRMK